MTIPGRCCSIAALTREARDEALCHQELLTALSPFLSAPPTRLGWSEAAERLHTLLEQRRGSLLIRFTYRMLHLGDEYSLADVPGAGLANVAATVLNLMGYDAPEGYEPPLIKFVS